MKSLTLFFFYQKKQCLSYKKLALISPQVTETEERLTNVTEKANNMSAQSLLMVHILGDRSTVAPSPHGLPLQRQEARESGVRLHNTEMQQVDSYSVITASHIYNTFITGGKVERG